MGRLAEAHGLRFEHEETAPIRRPVDGLIAREAYPTPVQGHSPPLQNSLFEKDAIVFDDLKSRSVEYGAPDSGTIRVDFRACRISGYGPSPAPASSASNRGRAMPIQRVSRANLPINRE